MIRINTTRRALVTAAALAPAGLLFRNSHAATPALTALAEKAASEKQAVWYESSRPDEADRVIAAFNKVYPKARVRQESIPGGNGMAARVTQESLAGAATADIVTVGGGETAQLLKTDLIAAQKYDAYGVDPRLVFAGRAVNTAVSIYCIVYNKTMVKQKPTGWNDLLAPQYKGNVGTWARAAAFAELSKNWGEARVMDFYTKFLAQGPMFFNSAAPLAQAVASGEIALGLGTYHTALSPMKKGAPIDMVALDPTPVSSGHSFVTSKAAAPATAALFISWLASTEGNIAYENVVGRGSALLPATQTYKFLAGRQISEWPLDDKGPYAAIFEKMNRMVVGAKVR